MQVFCYKIKGGKITKGYLSHYFKKKKVNGYNFHKIQYGAIKYTDMGNEA